MQSRLHDRLSRIVPVLLTAAMFVAAGCSSMNSSNQSSAASGSAFVVGTDAPMAAITSFLVTVNSITLTDANGHTASLLSSAQQIDFARYNGLQTLLAVNSIPSGSYTSATISLGSGTIGYLQTSTTGPPAIETHAADITQTSVTVSLSQPLVVTQSGPPAGLRVELNLAKSIQVDSTGQITFQVNPVFTVKGVAPGDSDAHIDELVGSVVSVDAGAQSFVLQGPHGMQFTVDVTSKTDWEGNVGLGTLGVGNIVKVSGGLGSTIQTINADDVTLLSAHGFYASGQVTYVEPASGKATSFDLYVRDVLPANTAVKLGTIAPVNLTGNEKFYISWMNNPMTQFLFNSSAMVPGQAISIGGPVSGATNPATVNRVVLRHWGFVGTVLPNTLDSSTDSFQMQVNGFAGVLIPETITVYLTGETEFRDGFKSMADITENSTVRVVGLLLRDTTSGKVILLAHYADNMKEDN